MRKRVYIAHAISLGDRVQNVADAVKAMRDLFYAGYAPFCPGLSSYVQDQLQFSHSDWLELDLPWVAACDAVLRLPGESVGADREVALARSLSVPVFDSIGELRKYFEDLR